MTAPISWCGEPLAAHLALTAYAAQEAYGPEWAYATRRLGVPGWLLPLAAVLHDAGKALPCYQDDAAKACRGGGGGPRYTMHEYASAYAALALARLAGGLRGRFERFALLAPVAVAVLEHHHGMTGRLVHPLDDLDYGVEGRAGPCRGALASTASSREGLRAMLEAALGACRLAVGLWGPAACPPEASSLLEAALDALHRGREPPAWEVAFTYQKGARRYRVPDDAPELLDGAAPAVVATLAGIVTVADSMAATAWRRGPAPEPRSYLARLLRENPRLAAAHGRVALEAQRLQGAKGAYTP